MAPRGFQQLGLAGRAAPRLSPAEKGDAPCFPPAASKHDRVLPAASPAPAAPRAAGKLRPASPLPGAGQLTRAARRRASRLRALPAPASPAAALTPGCSRGDRSQPGKSSKLRVASQQVGIIHFQVFFLEPDPPSTPHATPAAGYFSKGPTLQARKPRPAPRHQSKASKGARVRNSELKAQLTRLPRLCHTWTRHKVTLLSLEIDVTAATCQAAAAGEGRRKEKKR